MTPFVQDASSEGRRTLCVCVWRSSFQTFEDYAKMSPQSHNPPLKWGELPNSSTPSAERKHNAMLSPKFGLVHLHHLTPSLPSSTQNHRHARKESQENIKPFVCIQLLISSFQLWRIPNFAGKVVAHFQILLIQVYIKYFMHVVGEWGRQSICYFNKSRVIYVFIYYGPRTSYCRLTMTKLIRCDSD